MRRDERLLDAKAAGQLLGVPAWLLAQARKDAVPWVPLGKYVRSDPREPKIDAEHQSPRTATTAGGATPGGKS
jgi:hypothetical protein